MSDQRIPAVLDIGEDTPWVVTVTLATAHEPMDKVLDLLADRCDADDITVSRRAGQPGLVFTGEACGGTAATYFPVKVAQIAEEIYGYGTTEPAWLVDIRMCTPDVHETEALRPDTPELMAATDVAELLGVSRQRVHQLRTSHPDFPEPYQQLGSGPIWTRPPIEHFADTWERKPGRRSAHTTKHPRAENDGYLSAPGVIERDAGEDLVQGADRHAPPRQDRRARPGAVR